jgi:hypothetical protein
MVESSQEEEHDEPNVIELKSINDEPNMMNMTNTTTSQSQFLSLCFTNKKL